MKKHETERESVEHITDKDSVNRQGTGSVGHTMKVNKKRKMAALGPWNNLQDKIDQAERKDTDGLRAGPHANIKRRKV